MLRMARLDIPRLVKNLKTTHEKLNKKISGTFIERMVNYIKNVYVDYREVAVQLRSDIKTKPKKSALYFTGFSFLMYSITHNPDEKSFRAQFIKYANDVSTVSSNLVNPNAVEHLKRIQVSYNRDLIRYTSLGLFSIIWIDKYSDQCNIYETKCSYLQLPYTKLPSQVIDVGFWNIWWVISRKMLDYDINY